jgi:hypothetical protein
LQSPTREIKDKLPTAGASNRDLAVLLVLREHIVRGGEGLSAVAVLMVRGGGGDDDGIGDRMGVTIAASYGSIQVGEGVFLC